jgi:hypothetical protein
MSPLLGFLVLGMLAVAPIAIVMAISRNRSMQREARAATVDLVVDAFGIRRELADGREEGVDWAEITEIEVYRTTTGPHGKGGGMLMLSGDETRGCLVPLDQLSEVVEGLSRLPGFDLRLLHEAVDRPAPVQLVVWRRDS